MKAAYRTQMGGPEVLTYGSVPDPNIGRDTVLIQVHAISLEGGDLLNRRIAPLNGEHHIVGYQASGTVVAIGSGVTRIAVGQKVVGFHWEGSHAELFAVPEQHAYPVPDSMDLDQAAMVPIAFGTASDALFEFAALKAGETVLVQGAAGGVGIAAVQLAHKAGARVIATASSTERLEALSDYGADEGINYRTEHIGERISALTQGKGVDVVIDLAGGKSLSDLIAAVRYRGRFCVVGASSGDLPAFHFMDLLSKGLTLHGVLFGLEMGGIRAHALIHDLLGLVHRCDLKMPSARTFRLDQAMEAHSYAEQGHPFGRVIIKP